MLLYTGGGMMAPAVSVVMPAYNSEQYIRLAVASVIAQTFTDWELIIVDDCSTDHTFEIVQKLAETDGRIKTVRNEVNLGAAATRNAAFKLCSGKYIALLDSDDLWEPDKLQKQIMCAESSHADIICCSYAIIDKQGNKKCADFIVPDCIDYKEMLVRSMISCSTAVLSRRVVEQEQFPTNMYHEDFAYWMNLLNKGYSAIGISEVLASYRVVEGSRASNKFKSAVNRWKVYRNYLGISVPHSSALLIRYMYYGIVKYRKVS